MNLFAKLANWVSKFYTTDTVGMGNGYTDIYNTFTAPSDNELLNSYRNIAFVCANLNARSTAACNIRLYATSGQDDARPTKMARPISKHLERSIRQSVPKTAKALHIDEVVDHPLLTLLNTANSVMNRFEVLELTSIYLDIIGRAYWYFPQQVLGAPTEFWVLPTNCVTPVVDDTQLIPKIIRYDYRRGSNVFKLPPESIIDFRGLNPESPYAKGLSSLFAGMETFRLVERDIAMAASIMENRGRPDLFIAPKDPGDSIGLPEAQRMEKTFLSRFRRGRTGGLFVSRFPITVQNGSQTSKDIEGLARNQAAKVAVANCFDVPIALLEAKEINRATLEAAMVQHARYGVIPRITRIVEKLNQNLVPLFNDRLFLWFDNPVPEDEERNAKIRESNITTAFRTINEERERVEENPVSWGDDPWVKGKWSALNDLGEEPKQTNTSRTMRALQDGLITRSQAVTVLVKRCKVSGEQALLMTKEYS